MCIHTCVLCAQVTDAEERKRLVRQYAAEREAAKARILQVGNQLLAQGASGAGLATGSGTSAASVVATGSSGNVE